MKIEEMINKSCFTCSNKSNNCQITDINTNICGKWKRRTYPDDFINKVINADCLLAMKQIPDKSIDLILTDPPYEKEAHTNQRRTRAVLRGDKPSASISLDFSAITEETRNLMIEQFKRICKGWVLVFCQAEAVGKYQQIFRECYRRPMIWVKPDGMAQFTGDRPAMGYESIIASWCGEGKSKWNGGGSKGVYI